MLSGSEKVGAYGFRIIGTGIDFSLLVEAPPHWPSLEVRVAPRVTELPRADYLDDRTATLRIGSRGSVSVDRAAGVATYSLNVAPTPAALVHPHLASVAAVASFWRGRDSYHCGAFVAHGGVWGLLGDKGSGKSSTLASLSQAGVPVFSDDVLVLDGGTALAGPRSVDLRADAAHKLEAGEPLGVIGDRERWRLHLAPVPPELPIRGWVLLRWDQATTVRPLKGPDRLSALLAHRTLRVPPPDPTAPMELSLLPFLELSRPSKWESIESSVELLLKAIADLANHAA